MTKGLKRINNLSDVPDKNKALINLGLLPEDYAALRGIYPSLGIDFSVIGNIAGSAGNYQNQIDGITLSLSGVVLSGFVSKSGNNTIQGSWTNSGGTISVSSGLPSGYPPSSDSLFALSIENNEAVIVCSGLTTSSGLSFETLRGGSGMVSRATISSGTSAFMLVPIQIGGVQYQVEAQAVPP